MSGKMKLTENFVVLSGTELLLTRKLCKSYHKRNLNKRQ